MAGRCLLLGALLLLGCKKPEPSVPELFLEALELRDVTTDGLLSDVRPDPEPIVARWRELIEKSGLVRPRDQARSGHALLPLRIRAEFALDTVTVEQKGLLRVGLRVRFGGKGLPAHFTEDVTTGGQAPFVPGRDDTKVLFGKLITRVLTDVTTRWIAQQRLWLGEAAEIDTALASSDAHLRVAALRAIGERKLRVHVPRILQMLDDPDETVRDAALGALVELRETGAVEALTRRRGMGEPRELRKIIDAVAAMGGDEARTYLEYLSVSHDDEEVRKMAADALGRLMRRQRR